MGRKKKKPHKRHYAAATDDRLQNSTEALVSHRELEFLRDAARAGSGRVPPNARKKLDQRARLLAEARRIAGRD